MFHFSGFVVLIVLAITLPLFALLFYSVRIKRNVRAGLKMLGITFLFEANDTEQAKGRGPF